MRIKNEKKVPFYRQGDVLLKRLDKLPTDKNLQPLDHTIVAYGEATGHNHKLANGNGGQVLLLKDATNSQDMYVQILEQPAELVHQEHKPQLIEEGAYAVIREREVDPFQGIIQRVRD